MSSILSKFTKPISTQPNFGGTGKYGSGTGKSYLWNSSAFWKKSQLIGLFQKVKFTLFF